MGEANYRLLEKRLSDQRYRKTEEKILRAFFEEDNYISTTEMARKAKVSRSTLHRHHRKVAWIVRDYERYILWKYTREMRRALKKERVSVKQLYLKMLLFIRENKKGLELVVIKGKSRWVLEKMVGKMRPKLTRKLRLKDGSRKKFRVYVAEVVEILVGWGENGFKREDIEKVLLDIMYLTEVASARLGGLKEN